MSESNKTEKATPKKRRDERKKGNAFQSRDVVSVVMLAIGFFLILKLGGFIVKQIETFYVSQLYKAIDLHELTVTTVSQIIRQMVQVFFITTVPIILILAFTAALVTGAQTRFLVSGDLLKFKLHRISIVKGVKRMFSLRSIVQLLKSIIKIIVIMAIILTSLKGLLVVIPDVLNASLQDNIEFMVDRVRTLVYKICLIFIGVAILDFAYQKYEHEKKLKMSKQEVKDEYKLTEGDPFIKGKIKEKQQKMSMNRMIQQIPTADVIVKNPTHYAVALKYDIEKDQAPIVVGKGQDFIARKIIKVAETNKIPIKEDKPLARGLYESVEINEYVPVEFYQIVAELMAWVYNNKSKESKKE